MPRKKKTEKKTVTRVRSRLNAATIRRDRFAFASQYARIAKGDTRRLTTMTGTKLNWFLLWFPRDLQRKPSWPPWVRSPATPSRPPGLP